MDLCFTKLQSAGNDFILIEKGTSKADYPGLARFACNRRLGIGADGLLVLTSWPDNVFGMQIFNPDGSEAEACGNGLRCMAKYIFDNRLVQDTCRQIMIDTASGKRTARLIEQTKTGARIETSMGTPEFRTARVPVILDPECSGKMLDINMISDYPLTVYGHKLRLSFISMGNPHAVYFTREDVNKFPLAEIGPAVENHSMFPRRTNFEIARVVDRAQIDIRVWERGAGETLACGSGACAVAIAAYLLGLVDSPVSINVPGGILRVHWPDSGQVYLEGTAHTVFNGYISDIQHRGLIV